ncbi:unnamed protein product [Fusarium fujikuroi]|nr:uncharacterized protein FFE2_15971 [Fusarium fujikuroi]VZI11151.1 unnamed protein product [Fusarium fujikuroi]
MFRARFPTAHHWTVSLFGCQYHGGLLSHARQQLVDAFDSLIKSDALHVVELEQTDIPSKVWLSYWGSPQSFKSWWESPRVVSFWINLPSNNAGFWRETVSLPATRSIYESNQDRTSGSSFCAEVLPLPEKTGYWGAYHSRITPDDGGKSFSSPLESVPERRPFTQNIRHGRIRMKSLPDNLCFVIEGQDYSAMSPVELEYWNRNFDNLAKQWVHNVVTGGSTKGLVSARGCDRSFKDENHGGFTEGNVDTKVTSSNNTEVQAYPFNIRSKCQVQLLFWLDISKMEHMGKWDQVHVKLRRRFMQEYGPGGAMEGSDLLLWVDLGIVKGKEIDAEYIGGYDSTGFMAYDDHPSF